MVASTAVLAEPLTLPCGVTVKNRFFKAPMHEALGTPELGPSQDIVDLYRRWAAGGAGILVTGNVAVDSRHLGEPGNIGVEDETHLEVLRRWAQAGTAHGTQLWMQINHPGRQSPRSVNRHPVAPSEVPGAGGYSQFFEPPRELSREEIGDIVRRFVTTARIAKKAGFTGVEIHAAHGYLISQFLSPVDNYRTDEYGGSLEGRMRLLIEIYQGMRQTLGTDFPIAVKLNSSDGDPGGMSQEDSLRVAARLSELGVDVLEVSGGTYRRPVFEQTDSSEEDRRRGVYFADYARRLKELVSMPVALTGGFRSASNMEEAVAEGFTDLVGIGRPLTLIPDLPQRILHGAGRRRIDLPRVSTGVKMLDDVLGGVLIIGWYEMQMHRLARGRYASARGNGFAALAFTVRRHGLGALMPRRVGRRG